MDLDSINFKVITKPLEDAVTLLDTATVAVKNLTKATIDNTAAKQAGQSATKEELTSLREQAKLKGAEADAAKKSAQAAEAESKAKVAKIREEKELTKVVKDSSSASDVLTESMTASERILAKQALSMQILRGEVITTSDGVAFLGSSFTKSQAGMLANLQLLGATGKELQTLSASFKDYNAITGLNTFDKSASGISKMKKELQELNEVNSISASGLALTRDEITNFVRDSERLVQQQKSEGHSAEWLAEEQKQLRASYISTSVELNRLRAESKQMEDQARLQANAQIKAANDTAKAQDYVAREMNRVQQATINSRDGTTTSTSNQLVRMEAALKASGISAGEAANKIRVYKDQLLALQKVANNKQIDNISRALGPQITDIGVGLATGQSPLTILLQQGGQLRDQMVLAGVAAEDMGKAIRRAGTEMGSSIWTTGKGVITGIGGALIDMGKSAGEGVGVAVLKMVDFTNKVQGTTKALVGGASYAEALKAGRDYQNRFNAEVANGNGVLSKMFDMLTGSVASSVFAVGLVALVATLVTLATSAWSSMKAMTDLNRSLLMTGASLGLTRDSAIALGNSLNGIEDSQAVAVLAEMAKQGGFTRQQFDEVATSADYMTRVMGLGIDQVVKSYSELNKAPLQALLKLQMETGKVNEKVIEQVASLERQGSAYKAIQVASEEMGRVHTRVSSQMLNEMSVFEGVLWGISDIFTKIGQKLRGLMLTAPLAKQLEESKAKVAELQAAGYDLRSFQLQNALKEQREIASKLATEEKRAREEQRKATVAGYRKTAEELRKEAQKGSTQEAMKKMNLEDFIESSWELKIPDSKTREWIRANSDAIDLIESEFKRKWTDMQKKPTTSPTTGAVKAANELTFYEKTLNQANKALYDQLGAIEELTKAQTKLSILKLNPDFEKLSKAEKDELIRVYELASATESYANQLEKHAKLKEDILALDLEYKALAESEALRQQLTNQELDHELELLGKTVEQQKALNIEFEKKTKLQDLELKLKKDIAEAEKKYGPDIVAAMDAEKQLYETYAKDVELINKGAAVASAKAYFEEFDKIRGAVSETISDALFHGGKGGSKKLRDAIMDQLKKPINVVINVIANAVTNGIQGMLGGGQSSIPGVSGGMGGLGDIVGLGKSLYSMFTGGAGASLVSSVSGGIAGLAETFGSSTLAEFAVGMGDAALASAPGAMGLGAQAGSLLGTIGSAMPYIGAAMVVLDAIGATERWAGDPDAFLVQDTVNNNVKNVDPKSALKRGILGKYGKDVPVEVRTGNPYQTSTTTPFGTIGFASGNAVIKKNGQLISEYGETEDVSTENQKAVLKVFETYDKVVAGALSESQVAKVAKNIQGWYMKSWSFEGDMMGAWISDRYRTIFRALESDIGNTFANLDINEGNLSNIIALFTIVQGSAGKITGLVDSITSFADGTSKYIRENEKGAEALIRLITNLEASNKLLDAIGQKTFASSLVGADMAQQLVDLFGSLANFQSGLSTYYDKFYTEQEKVATSTKNLQIVFKAMGMTMPQSTAQFRKLVDAQDLTTTKGRETFTALIGISSAFADLMQPVDEATNKMKEFTASILEYIANLTLTEGASGNTFNAVKGQFAAQIGKARGGDTSAMDSITDYADRVLEVAKDTATSTYEYEKILGSVKAELLGLTNGQTAGTILTTAAVTSSTTSTSPITTIADSSASTQELLVSILAKLTEMQSEERAEGEASVTNLSTIAKVFKRIDNGDSIRVINV